ncbi:hypothetical protein JR316_0008661 [Psilocybe cubensis]|uniref:Uncharacterized protein n=2 Tax=Psilocybe cubensis TaxID=181762 RepID=A0A8H8CKB0_PSICU|nr:hypothetical protein JR316_0008661 [Psilocybe cubensis]KAH9478208.1 hypothetical protein JR316_0008661 [Psilocybe cubensis]
MPVQAALNQPFSMFSRGSFGLSSRSRDKKTENTDEDWYIPYNGPYEPPKEQPRKQKARDSWGFPVDDYEDDSMLADRELHLRYGGHNDFNPRGSSDQPAEEERKGRSRDRTLSVISGRTTSSGAMDPNRPSLTLHRRSTVSGNPPPVPSYINLDSMGGVGESPVPHVRQSKDTNRISIASIFSFGVAGRKVAQSPSLSAVGRKSSTRLLKPTSDGPYGMVDSPTHTRRDSSSSGSRRPSDATTTGRPNPHQTDQTSLIVTDEEDYYNSYYETLLRPNESTVNHPYQSRSPSSSGASNSSPRTQTNSISRQNSNSSTSAHPYAYAFPRTEAPEPRTAPLTPAPRLMPAQGLPNPPRLTFTTPQPHAGPSNSNGVHSTLPPPSGAASKSLKNSTSTPDFRTQTLVFGKTTTIPNKNGPNSPTYQLRRGMDRWLSAETWCDALLFPRPRLRIKQEPIEGPIKAKESSGRIVSPPLTPTEEEEEFGSQQLQPKREPGFASRVLAHSRSMVDLHKGKRKPEDVQHANPSKGPQGSRTGGAQASSSGGRPPRPKSFAMDDLALLPTPVMSLAHVLREGELLETERREWQRQAKHSFGNKRARSMSRTRTKSLTQKGRQGKHSHQSSMEYIAARACLGTQDLTPVIAPAQFTTSFTESNATTSLSAKTHSHTNSLVKTLTKSSKAHSRTHSRNDSWGKSAMKVAKSTVLCGHDTASSLNVPNADAKGSELEGALARNETKVIRLADPAMLPVDRGQPGQSYQNLTVRNSPSPANSGISDSKVGIALGTPPEEENEYMPNHPYAQGGLSFSHGTSASADHPPRHTDFAGPHPSINMGMKVPAISDIIARHKLPPYMVLHPYAQTQRDSYLDANGLVGQFRSEDSTPHGSKMWAQLSPGVVREILPHDLQYSPFSPNHGSRLPHTPDRSTLNINDTVGVGETLVNAARFRADNDKGTLASGKSLNLSPKGQDQLPTLHLQSSQPSWEHEEEDDQLAELNPISRRNGVLYGSSQHGDEEDIQILRVPSFERTQSASSGNTSTTSSPRTLPQPLGSPNDLDNFQDLFYRPTGPGVGRTPNEAALPETPSPPNRGSTPWENMPNRRTGSSLTSLARKLSEEFEMLSHERERSSNSQYSQSPPSSQRPSRMNRHPTEGSLQFVFEEMGVSGSPPNDSNDPILAFHASGVLPEDVQADSRASSFIQGTDEDDDQTARFRMGVVESVSTPPAVSAHHVSFDGQMAYVHDNQLQRQDIDTANSSGRILSSLMPPTEATRSSYMTTSTLSRMSGLSDFPAPPKDEYITPKHMSILSSYFDEALTQSESRLEPLPPPPMLLQEERVTFGGNQDAKTVAQTLSSSTS